MEQEYQGRRVRSMWKRKRVPLCPQERRRATSPARASSGNLTLAISESRDKQREVKV